jgi:hypothetical protein
MQEGIGTLQESSLHAGLKQWYFRPGDLVETKVDGYTVDLVRGDLCLEVQTNQIYKIKEKVFELLFHHPVRVIYPVPHERFITRIDIDTEQVISKRKSPKQGSFLDIFTELVYITQLVKQNNFSIEVLLIREELILVKDGRGSRRRKGWSILDRRLIEVLNTRTFSHPDDYLEFLPAGIKVPFTVNEVARELGCPRNTARKMLYALREIGLLKMVGKSGNAFLYQVKDSTLVA